jgi:enamine deaminase RidA (YjgF/YER057c/UK114 family)
MSDIKRIDTGTRMSQAVIHNAPARACGEAKLATPDYTVEIIIVAAQ